MFHQIPKRINVNRNTSSNISRSRAITKTRFRILHLTSRRSITSKTIFRECHQTNKRPFHFSLNTIRNDADTRRKKGTIAGSVDSGFKQQLEHHIPDPTWSLQDLELTSTHTAITQQELERLARLVLVDVSKNCEDDIIDSMKQDLGNMLNMIKHVTMRDCEESIGDDIDDSNGTDLDDKPNPTGNATVYDTVRGLRVMPLRKVINLDPLQAKDAPQALDILEKTLDAKMVRRGGGHKYFAIKTTEP